MTAAAPRWGLVFLACPLPLEDAQKSALMKLAARAWFDDLPETHFDWGELRGTVRPSSDTVSLGTFVGQSFTAEVHGASGEAQLRFLVAEQVLRAQGGPVAEA